MESSENGPMPSLIPLRKKGDLNCPDCNVIMEPYLCQSVIIDKCSECEGIWFDDKEFGIFKKTLDSNDLTQILSIDKPVSSEDIQISGCPRCSEPLCEFHYGYNSGIEFKKCDSCHGLWLPLIESLKLIEHAKVSQEISDDVKGLVGEFKKLEKDRERSNSFQLFGSQLGREVPYYRRYLIRYFAIFLPLYDENPRSIFPAITVSLIFINVAVFFLTLFMGIIPGELYQSMALFPGDISSFRSVLPLVTSVFLHGGVLHLLGNMFYLWTFGDNVEERLGGLKYLGFYFLTGIVAGLVHVISDPSSMNPTIGASGAISGILGAYFVYFPHVSIRTLAFGYLINIPAWFYLGFWIVMQIFWMLIYSNHGGGGVAWWAHIGGFTSGALLAYLQKSLKTKKA